MPQTRVFCADCKNFTESEKEKPMGYCKHGARVYPFRPRICGLGYEPKEES